MKPEYPLASPANGHRWGPIKSSNLISLVFTPSAQMTSSWCKVTPWYFLGVADIFHICPKCLLLLALRLFLRTPWFPSWVPAIAKREVLGTWKFSWHSVFDVVGREGAAIEMSPKLYLHVCLLVFHGVQVSGVWEKNAADRHYPKSEVLSLL